MLLKYPGGKGRAGSRELISLFPHEYSEFRSCFAGNEPLLWHVPTTVKRWINDVDPDLISYWKALRDDKNYCKKFFNLLDSIESADELVEAFEAAKHKVVFDRDPVAYLFLRRLAHRQIVSRDRPNFASFSYQYMLDGLRPVKPVKVKEAQAICKGIKITCGSYKKVLKAPAKNALIFIDPPYHTESDASPIYHHEMNPEEHKELRNHLAKLNPRTHKFMLTLGLTELTEQLYVNDAAAKNFNVHYRMVRYGMTNPKKVWCTLSPKRRRSRELVVLNYDL